MLEEAPGPAITPEQRASIGKVCEDAVAKIGYAGLAVGVDINRHFNITLGYTAFVYADEYYDSDCDDDYTYDCDFNRADTVTLGVEARF